MPRFSQQVLGALANPQYGMLTGQAIANVGQRLSQIPENVRAEQQRQALQQATQLGVQGYAAGDPAMMGQAAKAFGAAGDATNAMAMAEGSYELQLKKQELDKLNARKTAMATRAEALGLDSVADSIRKAPDNDALNTIAKDLRTTEIERLPTQTPGQRWAMARQRGITKEEFDKASLAKATDKYFNEYINGEKGKTEAWMDAEGNVQAVRFSQSGRAWDESKSMFVEPSELGLVQPAPSVQKVIDASSKVSVALAEAGADEVIKMRSMAMEAKNELDIINRQIERLGNMPTGLAANVELGLRKVGQLVGMPYDPTVTDAETYMMEVANLVRQRIKAFGSGSSITDADREYTQRMVGGDITQQAESLERILKIYQQAAVKTINNYNDIQKSIQSDIGRENMSVFVPMTVPELSSFVAEEDPYKGFSIKGKE